MMRKALIMAVILVLICAPGVFAAKNVTSFDSTQPRGFGGPDDPLHPDACRGKNGEVLNDAGQDLCPIEGGIWTPFYYLGNDGQGSQARYFETWKGSMMGNGARDPAFFATLSVANQDVINLLNASGLNCYPDYLAAEAPDGSACGELQTQLHNLLVDPGIPGKLTPAFVLDFIGLKFYNPDDLHDCDPEGMSLCIDLASAPNVLQPEEILPVTADLCLRCHFTTDWLEGRSEPPTRDAPYLKGQFWGSKFREYPGWPGEPELLPVDGDQPLDSEAGMEGIQCMYCHRQDDNYKRTSNFDGATISNGIGGYFLMPEDPTFSNFQIRPTDNFQRDPFLCGTCHDVTNPLIREQNTLLTAPNPDVPTPRDTDFKHPIERTFTEWYWSDHGPGGGAGGGHCERCHLPMVFQGAQTWIIEGLDTLWGEVDRKWTESPYFYNNPAITPSRTEAYNAAALRSRDLLSSTSDAADVTIEQASKDEFGTATVTVRITNEAGHKLPTGFAEGRQMWIHITATDSLGQPIFESGYRKDFHGLQGLARYDEKRFGLPTTLEEPIKVYEHVSLAKNYDPFNLNGWNILDYTSGDPFDGTLTYGPDGEVSHFDKEFHFVLLNYVEKDNRIPPRGWIPEAYAADGAFVVEPGYDDNGKPVGKPAYDRYIVDGQPINYDDTTYTFDTSAAVGDIEINVEVLYQTFNEHYMEFLDHLDTERMEYAGGRARNAPCEGNTYALDGSELGRDGSSYACGFETWGDILFDIWQNANDGQPAQVGNLANAVIRDGDCIPNGISETLCNGVDDDCDLLVDEDYMSMPSTCGIGACAATGQMICSDGVEVDSCIPGLPSPEVCNDGIDNDCDGLTDCDDSDCSASQACGFRCRDAVDESTCGAGCTWDVRKGRCR